LSPVSFLLLYYKKVISSQQEKNAVYGVSNLTPSAQRFSSGLGAAGTRAAEQLFGLPRPAAKKRPAEAGPVWEETRRITGRRPEHF